MDIVADLVFDRERDCDFGVFIWSIPFFFTVLSGFNEDANNFFNIVEEQPGGNSLGTSVAFVLIVTCAFLYQ